MEAENQQNEVTEKEIIMESIPAVEQEITVETRIDNVHSNQDSDVLIDDENAVQLDEKNLEKKKTSTNKLQKKEKKEMKKQKIKEKKAQKKKKEKAKKEKAQKKLKEKKAKKKASRKKSKKKSKKK